ncbi:unnamed protein product [Lactuca saligna]|uniref:Uncharacterized protein n=1 Tax=Lactuca saligna TaxID=75948 RepID=A0AA36E1N2_LACSI|nr:unnamed protein product [Lactuca saligna]
MECLNHGFIHDEKIHRYVTINLMEMGLMSPLALGSTPLMSLLTSPMWRNKVNHVTPLALQFPESRLKTVPAMGLICRWQLLRQTLTQINPPTNLHLFRMGFVRDDMH